MMGQPPNVLILGGGPAALAALHSFRLSSTLSAVAYEVRARATGVWEHTPLPSNLPDEQISPVYDVLDTNIPKTLMRFTNHHWDPAVDLFPDRRDVEHYITSYAQDVKDNIRFREKVVHIEKKPRASKWTVITQHQDTLTKSMRDVDFVLIAGGNYNFPRHIPDVPGLAEWIDAGGTSLHSKYYRNAQDYKDKVVVVVGAGPSGVDIVEQVASVAKCVVGSIRNGKQGTVAGIKVAGSIERLSADRRTVYFEDGSKLEDVDAIIWCIGYLFWRPELHLQEPVEVASGGHMQRLYEHMFYIPDPTLAFVGLPQKVVPFPIAQAQSAVIRRVWEGRLHLPCRRDMTEWEQKRLRRMGDGRFHQMPQLEDADYINRCMEQCISVESDLWALQLECPYWSSRERWQRTLIPKFKQAFEECKRHGRRITSLEQLGFHWPPSSPSPNSQHYQPRF